MKTIAYNEKWMPCEELIRLWAVELPTQIQPQNVRELTLRFPMKLTSLLNKEQPTMREYLIQTLLDLIPEPDVPGQVQQIMDSPQFTNQMGELIRRDEGEKSDGLEKFGPKEVRSIYQQTTLESLMSVLSESLV
jgi:hypothetical protein